LRAGAIGAGTGSGEPNTMSMPGNMLAAITKYATCHAAWA